MSNPGTRSPRTALETLSPQAILRLEQQWTSSYFIALRETDPCFGAHERVLNEATAFWAPGLPTRAHNRIMGILSEPAELRTLLADAPADVPIAVDAVPGLTAPAVLSELGRRGFVLAGFHGTYAGAPQPRKRERHESVHVRPLAADEGALFTRVFARCGALPPLESDAARALEAAEGALLDREGWSGFLAEVDGTPAAVARLYQSTDGGAFMVGAFTIPDFRGRG